YKKTVVDNEVYTVPNGYSIDSYSDVTNESTANAFSTVSQAGDGKSLSIHAEATSHIWFKDEGSGACIDNRTTATLDENPARAERQVEANLNTDQSTEQVGEEEVLMITTRGLCCCVNDTDFIQADDLIVDIKGVPEQLKPIDSKKDYTS